MQFVQFFELDIEKPKIWMHEFDHWLRVQFLAVESYHRSEYEPFYRILDTMPETFLASIAPPDQTTARLHFNAYFLAKV